MEFFHLCGRGVEKRDIVLDDSDRLRFIHDLYVFNDKNTVLNFLQFERSDGVRKRDKLVDIHAYALMNNHYHLLVTEVLENGISLFMKKMNMGYAKYFNARYERSGALWQGKYRKVHIRRDAHFLYIPYYIHLNPLDYEFPEWRRGGVKNFKKALAFLETYRWSSYLDYQDQLNFGSVITKKVLKDVLRSHSSQKNQILDIISGGIESEGSNEIEYQK